MALGIGKAFYNTITYHAYTWDDMRMFMDEAGIDLGDISGKIDHYLSNLTENEFHELNHYFKPDPPKISLLSDIEKVDGNILLPLDTPDCVVKYYTAILGDIL